MQIALATGQPLPALLEAPAQEIATWIQLLNEQAEKQRRR